MDSAIGTEIRTNLIVNHLPHIMTDQDFEKLFADIGPIKNFRIMRDLKNGSSFGFGFVDYQKPADAAKAILQLNNFGIQHKRLKVSYAQPADGGESKDTNLYVQNLPKTFTVEKLDQLFSNFGTITQKLIFKDKATGLPKGVAFVRFKNRSEAYAAIEAMHGHIPEGETDALPLIVKIAKEGTTKKNLSFQAGYQAGLARGAGRGRSQFNYRGGFGRANYNDMGFGGQEVRGFGSPTEFDNSFDFSQQGGKIGLDRTNNRYNPISSSGAYGNTSLGLSSYGVGIGFRDTTPTQFSRVSGLGFTDSYGGHGTSFSSVLKDTGSYPSARY